MTLTEMKKGEVIRGHFCQGCLITVDKAEATPQNPRRTDWCVKCGHRSEGLVSTGKVGDWLIIGKTA